jgi:hypothetical protein
MASGISQISSPSSNDRLATFGGYWDDNEATARQLAAIGHVYDRPPLEAIQEGSRCCINSCSAFVPRETSIRILEGPLHETVQQCSFHLPRCERLQIRIPLEMHTMSIDSRGGKIDLDFNTMRRRFEKSDRDLKHRPESRLMTTTKPKTNFFSLPVELRLDIYSMLLPRLPRVTFIVQLHRDSNRVVTLAGRNRIGRRDLTQTNLLGTCKAIHREALNFLFHKRVFRFESLSSNNFNATSSKTLYLFLRHIGARGRAELGCVDICLGGREDAIAFALLASCYRLKSIVIRYPKRHLMAAYAPVWHVEGIASLFQLRGLENVEFGIVEGHEEAACLQASDQDAKVIMRELSKKRGEASGIRFVDGRWLDL